MFKSAYDYKSEEQQTLPTGNGYEKEYGYEINKLGQKVLVQTGETNIYEKIQAELESTLIENVLGSVATGDYSVLRPQGIYADISEQPKNLIEARQMIKNMETTWESMPKELKEKFDNDLETFINESGTEKWFDKLTIQNNVTEEPILPKTETKGEEA